MTKYRIVENHGLYKVQELTGFWIFKDWMDVVRPSTDLELVISIKKDLEMRDLRNRSEWKEIPNA